MCLTLLCVLQVRAPGSHGLADEDGLRERDRAGLVGRELCPGSRRRDVRLHAVSALEQTHGAG